MREGEEEGEGEGEGELEVGLEVEGWGWGGVEREGGKEKRKVWRKGEKVIKAEGKGVYIIHMYVSSP